MQRAATGIVVMLSAAACTTLMTPKPLNTAKPGATTFHAVTVGRDQRTFLLHLPPEAATRRVPLVIVLHGHTGNAEVARNSSQMNASADSLGMAVAYADGSGRVRGIGLSWNAGSCCGWAKAHGIDDLAFLDSIRVTLARSGHIDSTAIFVAGFSAGGMLALRVACERPGTVRGVADLAGAMPNYPCRPAAPVAVLLIRGDDDDDLREDHAIHVAEGAPPYATSLDSASAFWERTNSCSGREERVVPLGPSASVRVRVATGCTAHARVEIVSIPDHPHAWPGGRSTWWFGQKPSPAVNGSALVLRFFESLLR